MNKLSLSLASIAIALAGCAEPNVPPDDELAKIGEACSATIRCANGFCDDTDVCAAFLIDGETCTASSQCASGLCSPGGFCGKKGAEGEACTNLGCEGGLFCDTDDICRALFDDGATCAGPEQCLSGQCPAGTCEPRDLCAAFEPIQYPVVTEACDVDVSSPSRFVITTTDFGTGAVSTADISGRTVTPDVAVASTDAIPYYHDGLVYVVHRFGNDYIDILDPEDSFNLLGQFPVTATGVATTNPHAIAFSSDGLGFVTLNKHHELYVYDFARAADQAVIDQIDLSRFADDDGLPEPSLAFTCGDVLFVTIQRLDSATFAPVDCELLVAVDMATRETYYSPIPLLGTWARQVRPHPVDPTSVLILSTGIEAVNLATGEVTWAVPESVFTAENLGVYQILSFDLTEDASAYYVAATAPDFSVDIWRVSSSGVQSLEKVLSGLSAFERTLEIIGTELWFADRTYGASGVRVFDLTEDPPEEIAGPLTTGLPPYSMVAIP